MVGVCIVSVLLLLSLVSTRAQPVTIPGTRIIIMPGANLQVQGSGIQAGPVVPGPSVVPGIVDTNAPVFAFAYFDPPVIASGSWTTYRVLVSCPDGTVQRPERIPVPAGLTLTPGASEQQLVTVQGRIWRIWTFNFRATAEREGADLFIIPSYMADANGRGVAVPGTDLQITTPDDPAAQHPLELKLDLPDRTLYVGETIPVRVTASTSGGRVLHNLTKLELSGDAFIVYQDSMYMRPRKTWGNQGDKPASATNEAERLTVTIETDVLVTPLRDGPLRLRAQSQVTVEPHDGVPELLGAYRPLIEATPVMVNASNVPTANALPGYNGAIGQFALAGVTLVTNQVRVGEPVTLSLTFRGEGNLPTISAPEVPANDHWQVLPAVSEQTQMLPESAGLVRAFRYTFIPLTEQITETPLIPFSYFDPVRATFIELPIPPQPLTVLPGSTNELAGLLAATRAGPPQTPPREAEEDDELRPLADTPGRTAATLVPLPMREWFVGMQLVPAALLGGLFLWDRRRRFLAAHPEILACRAARRSCRAHSGEASAAVRSGDAFRFGTEIVQAMRALAAPRAGAHPDSIVCGDVLNLLNESQTSGKERELVRQFFAAVDAKQFSRGAGEPPNLLARRAEAEALLGQMLEDLRTWMRARVRHRRSSGVYEAPSALPSLAAQKAQTAQAAGLLLLTFLLAISVFATQERRFFQQGIGAYNAGEYERAATAFRSELRQRKSAGAFHNLGNAEWLRGNTGEAVLAWERAVWLDPFDARSTGNLRFARKTAQLDDPPFSWFEMCSAWLPVSAWAWIAGISFWASVAFLVLPSIFRWRRALWYQALAAAGLTCFLLTLPALAGIYSRAQRGVVLVDRTPLRLTPTHHGETILRLPAGQTARCLRRQAEFFYVRTAGGATGWVDRDGFTLIAR